MSMVPPLGESYLIRRIFQLGLGGDMYPTRMKGHNVPYEERTMFITFSKSYPVTELEIRKFFTQIFGGYIEYILMHEVKFHEQALYARIMFIIPGIVELILQNESKAKFSINRKHVWMQNLSQKMEALPSLKCFLRTCLKLFSPFMRVYHSENGIGVIMFSVFSFCSPLKDLKSLM